LIGVLLSRCMVHVMDCFQKRRVHQSARPPRLRCIIPFCVAIPVLNLCCQVTTASDFGATHEDGLCFERLQFDLIDNRTWTICFCAIISEFPELRKHPNFCVQRVILSFTDNNSDRVSSTDPTLDLLHQRWSDVTVSLMRPLTMDFMQPS